MNAGRRTSPIRFRAHFRRGPGRLLCLCLLLLCFGSVTAQETPGRIGYVDMQRLIDNAPQTLAARERLRQEFDRRDADLKAEIARLTALDGRIANESDTLGEAELTALRRQADTLRRSIERTQQRLREEFNARVDQELERTWPLINQAVADYARETGYDLVVPSPVVYVSGRVDITERVLDRLERDYARAQP